MRVAVFRVVLGIVAVVALTLHVAAGPPRDAAQMDWSAVVQCEAVPEDNGDESCAAPAWTIHVVHHRHLTTSYPPAASSSRRHRTVEFIQDGFPKKNDRPPEMSAQGGAQYFHVVFCSGAA
jgi:hypothetical protein